MQPCTSRCHALAKPTPSHARNLPAAEDCALVHKADADSTQVIGFFYDNPMHTPAKSCRSSIGVPANLNGSKGVRERPCTRAEPLHPFFSTSPLSLSLYLLGLSIRCRGVSEGPPSPQRGQDRRAQSGTPARGPCPSGAAAIPIQDAVSDGGCVASVPAAPQGGQQPIRKG
jgi:hypothetical protein